jgi:hypothetical protein
MGLAALISEDDIAPSRDHSHKNPKFQILKLAEML